MVLRKLTAAAVPLLALSLTGVAHAAAQPLITLDASVAPLAQSVRTGDLSATRQVPVALSLKLRDQGGLDKFLADVQTPGSPRYRHFLTPEQFTDRFGPSQGDVDQAVSFLRSTGANEITVSGNRQVITFTASAGQLASAFHTSLGTYTDRATGRNFYANDRAPAVPSAVSSVVGAVVGLDSHALLKHGDVHAKASTGSPQLVTPPILRQAYSTAGLPATGSGVNVGFVEFDGYDEDNIATYDNTYGLATGPVNTVSVNGADYDSAPGPEESEVELDIEVVHALAPAAANFVYEAPNTNAGMLAMYQKIASDNQVKVVSISWGACESDLGSSTAASVSDAIATGTAEGITYLASAGDAGASDCYRSGGGETQRAVDFPASSPSATGVGGTQLSTTSSGGYGSETTWNDGNTDGSTGGGTSTFFGAPSWQARQATGRRQVPDVSADAAKNSAYRIYTTGRWESIWGTSAAAPLWAGFVALQNQIDGGPLGDLNPSLYAIGNSSSYSTGFHDVTTGNNTLYGTTGFSAKTGYDQTTGWGTPIGTGLSGLLG